MPKYGTVVALLYRVPWYSDRPITFFIFLMKGVCDMSTSTKNGFDPPIKSYQPTIGWQANHDATVLRSRLTN